MSLPVMIFAAGRGTRMAPLTDTRPKPLIEVAGRALLDHAREQAGARRIVVNSHYMADQIARHLDGSGIAISHEPTLLDTGGGLLKAAEMLGSDTVFTLNSDAVWTGASALDQLERHWRPEAMGALLLLADPARAHGHRGRGDFIRHEDGRLSFGPGAIYTGAQIIKLSALDGLSGAFSLRAVWERLAPQGRLHGVIHQGQWCDVGHPGGIALAETMLEQGDV